MGMVVSIEGHKGFFKKLRHYLFNCPTFWHPTKWITCTECGKKMFCYWDGNDISNVGIDYCNKCASKYE